MFTFCQSKDYRDVNYADQAGKITLQRASLTADYLAKSGCNVLLDRSWYRVLRFAKADWLASQLGWYRL